MLKNCFLKVLHSFHIALTLIVFYFDHFTYPAVSKIRGSMCNTLKFNALRLEEFFWPWNHATHQTIIPLIIQSCQFVRPLYTIYVHKCLISKTKMDLYFRTSVLEGDKEIEYCQFNKIDVYWI